jgi:hypothetical protein
LRCLFLEVLDFLFICLRTVLELLFFKSANLSSLFLGVILELLGLVFLLNDFNHSLFNLHIFLEFKVLEVTSMLD